MFNDQSPATMNRSENHPFFQQNKNMTNKHHTRNQPQFLEGEDYFSQNQQQFSTNPQNNNRNIDEPEPIYQPASFEPYTRNEQDKTQFHIIITFNHRIL